MVDEPTAKCHHGETSDKSYNLDDVHVPGEKRAYTKTLKGIELHGNETLEIVCTNKPHKADEMITRFWRKAGGCIRKIVGLGVHYTREDEPPQMAAVLPKRLNEMLKHEKLFTFASFSIESDKEKMKMSGLPTINPNKYVVIRHFWRVPYTRKDYDSLTDVAASVIHPFYKDMKKNIDTPLPDKLIEYAATDVYATFKSWQIIDNITDGREIAKAREGDHYYDRPFCPF
ncbi:hypothetical protein VPH35_053278 [Triticum aestivum]